MRFLHLSDLHLGKRLREYSLLEDQKYVLQQILESVDAYHPDCVLISGDVYDKPIPPIDAVKLFDEFIRCLAERNVYVFIIGGNHDSQERLSCYSDLLSQSKVYIASAYSGKIDPITLQDDFGAVNIYMLPFIRPIHVKSYHPDKEIASFTDAVSCVIEDMAVNQQERNVLLCHQYVTGAERSDSEDVLTVGGIDNVDGSVFAPFDYVALGHIHKPQIVGDDRIRYCGSPLKYSFSEANHTKSILMVDLDKDGKLDIQQIPLKPLRDMQQIRGTFAELTNSDFYENSTLQSDYVKIVLTDEENIVDVFDKLKVIYKNMMELQFDNSRTRYNSNVTNSDSRDKSTLELLCELFELQNNKAMDQRQINYIKQVISCLEEKDETN